MESAQSIRHLQELETDARESERELHDLRERNDQRLAQLNDELNEHYARVSSERAYLMETMKRKEISTGIKQYAVEKWKVQFACPTCLRGRRRVPATH
jgi:hypothetical protein